MAVTDLGKEVTSATAPVLSRKQQAQCTPYNSGLGKDARGGASKTLQGRTLKVVPKLG